MYNNISSQSTIHASSSKFLLPQSYNNIPFYSLISVHRFRELLKIFFGSKDQVGKYVAEVICLIEIVLKWIGGICKHLLHLLEKNNTVIVDLETPRN